jgi:hypothetical protein
MVSQAASRAVGKLSVSTCAIQPFAKPCASSVSIKRSGVQRHVAIANSLVWLRTATQAAHKTRLIEKTTPWRILCSSRQRIVSHIQATQIINILAFTVSTAQHCTFRDFPSTSPSTDLDQQSSLRRNVSSTLYEPISFPHPF